MSRDKQIEEMANVINEMDEPNAHYYDENLQNHEAFADCFTIAKHLVNNGYRKASVGEWVDRYKGAYANPIFVCSVCDKGTLLTPHINELGQMEMVQAFSQFCPHCGAKMKYESEG